VVLGSSALYPLAFVAYSHFRYGFFLSSQGFSKRLMR